MSLNPINATGTGAAPIDGFGTILEYSTDNGSTWQQIANLLDIKPAGKTSNKIKKTTHSTTGGSNQYRAGLGEPGETEATLMYDKTALNVLNGIYREDAQWRVTYNDEATDVWGGYLAEIKPNTPLDGDATIEIKIQHSGADTFTPGT